MTLSKTLLGPAKAVRDLFEDAWSTGPELARALDAVYGGASPFASVDPLALARQVRERVRRRAEARAVEVVVVGACGPVWVQPRAFAEALFRLVDNAVRASRAGGKVVVAVRESHEEDVIWWIQDTGEGMSDRALSQLGRLPRTLSPDGSGLGVPLAWAVIENHGGLLHFDSERGVGTTASIWLPRVRSARRRAS